MGLFGALAGLMAGPRSTPAPRAAAARGAPSLLGTTGLPPVGTAARAAPVSAPAPMPTGGGATRLGYDFGAGYDFGPSGDPYQGAQRVGGVRPVPGGAPYNRFQAFRQAQAQRGGLQAYLDMLGQSRGRMQTSYQEMLDLLSGVGSQREADIRGGYAERESDVRQGLARQGLAGTTIAPTMQMGVAREQESALNRLAESMAGQRLGVMQQRVEGLSGMDRLMAELTGRKAAISPRG